MVGVSWRFDRDLNLGGFSSFVLTTDILPNGSADTGFFISHRNIVQNG